MEDKSVVDQESIAGAPTSSRWNPTKEQISVLESLYKQGMRTPSAEQIQQITSRLKVYGHIEGKNVFYWFQNHKARQRQKQKQECMVYINQFLHKAAATAPVFTPTPLPPTNCSPNVVCSPYYIPQNGIGYYPQHAKVPLMPCSTGVMRRRPIAVDHKVQSTKTLGCDIMQHRGDVNDENTKKNSFHETLALFPLHPTGILEQRRCENSSFSSSVASESGNINPSIISSGTGFDDEDGSGSPSNLIDFFAGHTSSESGS